MLLIGAYIPRTQFSIKHATVPVICIYSSLSTCLLYWGNPAVAECFCDQTLLTPPVNNLGNGSSSLQRETHIAIKAGFGGGGSGSEEAFSELRVWLVGNARSLRGWRRSCACVCVRPFRDGEPLLCIQVISLHSFPSQVRYLKVSSHLVVH